ncbi:hypothetical protein OIY81_2990 [Cryptosporidium canis]|nr:hypothetical protein OIY81_2990 [Cryptosporidium canis]
MSSFFSTVWLSHWSKYITHGNSNPGYPLLFHGDSPLIWIHRLREAFSRNRNHFWLPLLQVYGRSIINALFLKLAFLLSCCLCSVLFTQTVSSQQGSGATNTYIFLILAYLLRSVVDAHARLYLARVTIRLESGLTGIIFYRLLSARGSERSKETKLDGSTVLSFDEVTSKIRLEIEGEEPSRPRGPPSLKDLMASRPSRDRDELETVTYSKSLKYLIAEPDVFSMLVGDLSAIQLFLSSLIDCRICGSPAWDRHFCVFLPIKLWISGAWHHL